LAEQLNKAGVSSLAIHGNKSQGARTRALGEFKSGSLRVLVATDIAARGIDINELPVVVNFELPQVAEDYIHRIGRTGRAGASGHAVALVCIDEKGLLNDIERLIKKELVLEVVPGFEPDPRIKAEPLQKQRGAAPRQRQSQGRPQDPRTQTAHTKPAHLSRKGGDAQKPVVTARDSKSVHKDKPRTTPAQAKPRSGTAPRRLGPR
jgi:ATP-dependent RNA helicase RhlE